MAAGVDLCFVVLDMSSSGKRLNTFDLRCCLLFLSSSNTKVWRAARNLSEYRRHQAPSDTVHTVGASWAAHLSHIHRITTLRDCCMFAGCDDLPAMLDLFVVESRSGPAVLVTAATLLDHIWRLPRSSEHAKLSLIFPG
jgi:hypothetical protein